MSEEFEVTTSQPVERHKGVYRTSWGNRWFSSIRREGKLHYLGTYETPEGALEAYLKAASVLDD